MSLNNLEKFKSKIANKQLCVGTCISAPDPAVSELFADAGYDFVWIDTEHNCLALTDTLGHVMAARGTDMAPLVRVPWNDAVLIQPVLEFEPAGIIVPLIRTAADAMKAVQACKYPPLGVRGFGPRRGVKFGGVDTLTYLQDADNRTLVIVQIEHIDAVKNIDTILAVPGLDGIAVGPNDLSGSMGLLGQTNHPDVAKVIDEVCMKVRKTKLCLGVATGYSPENVQRWINRGVQWISLNNDYNNMYLYAKVVLDGTRSIEIKSNAPAF
jgi:2-keto-3-deoxy-L-rhamnonate aldolase RhmA